MSLYYELKRRGVVRLGAAYLAVAWLILQILDVVRDILVIPAWVGQYTLLALALGLPVALVLAWVYELTPEGVKHMDDAGVVPVTTKFGGRKIDFVIIGALLLVISLLIVDSYVLHPGRSGTDQGIPMVSNVTQLTKSQLIFPPTTSRYPMVLDKSRIYFSDWKAGQMGISEVSTHGGEAVRIPDMFKDLRWLIPNTMAPDGVHMVINAIDLRVLGSWGSLWQWPVVGGSPRFLSEGSNATYSADGQRVFYMKVDFESSDGPYGLFLANADFTDPVKLGTAPGNLHWPKFSPDGSRIRYHFGTDQEPDAIWEISIDGTDHHPLLPDWELTPHCCGSWTPDGRYYLFQATHDDRTQLWAIREEDGIPLGSQPTPVQISKGALDLLRPLIAENGSIIYAIGWQLRGEVAQYNHEAKRFVSMPGLESLSAEWLSWSRDQEQLAYVSYPEADLWRSRPDGSGRLQLTFPPMKAWNPHWSPDGQLIAFRGQLPGQVARIYLVPADGGNPRPITTENRFEATPTWSADGMTLAFDAGNKDKIQLLDISTGIVSDMEGTDGLWWPSWSPDGNHMAVISNGSLKLFDVRAGHLETLVEDISLGGYQWASNSRYIYYDNSVWSGPDSSVYRVDIESKVVEKVVPINDVRITWGVRGMWVGVSPDGAPLILRDLSIHHIYALDWLSEQVAGDH